MQTAFEETVQAVRDNVVSKGYYAPYISFTILGNGSTYGDVTFTTDELSKCYITGLKNDKNGSGKANSFSIDLAFSPSKPSILYPNDSQFDTTDPNVIDYILLNARNEETGLIKCKLSYGYSAPKRIVSPEYEGMILDYSVDLESGILKYTITGYSDAVAMKDIKINVKSGTFKPTERISELYREVISKYTDYSLYFEPDTLGTDKEVELEAHSEVSPFEYIQVLLEHAEYINDSDDTEEAYRSTYLYYINDASKKIVVKRYDPRQGEVSTASRVQFSWMAPAGNEGINYATDGMVLGFQTQYKGSVGTALKASKNSGEATKYGIDAAGEAVKDTGNNPLTTGANATADNMAHKHLWTESLQYAYLATLTLVGIPCEIAVLDQIYVYPMIYGQVHHTGGLYLVKSVTDMISSGGFTTSISLIRSANNTE